MPPSDRLELSKTKHFLLGESLRESSKTQTQIQLSPSPNEAAVVAPLASHARLDALDELAVLDEPPSRAFQVLVDMANQLLGTPVSLISLVTDKRQFFLSSSGLPEPWATCRETPLSHSFCQHVVQRNEPLVVTDAKTHELVSENLAVEELGVIAYLGVPIVMPDGNVIGSFCAINDSPRAWTQDDREILEKLVALAVGELEYRKAFAERHAILKDRLREAQKMRSIGQLVGGVAHDFNNVLGAIQFQADLLEATSDGSAEVPVGRIRETIDSAKSVVQQLLNWSRPTSGTKTSVSLGRIVSESLSLISSFSTKFIEIQFEPSADNDMIFADVSRIHQILLNLCSNAAHAMKNKAGKILIAVEPTTLTAEKADSLDLEEGDYVKLQVTDQGCGIPPESLSKIHTPYFTTKPVGEGTGLGLWMVFGGVEYHHGKIHVESVVGEGTTVEIFFPLCAKTADPTNEAPDLAAPMGGEAKPVLRLLVVDDDVVITTGLDSLFKLSGHEVSTFTNSCEALKAFVDNPESFDLIITDQVMPAMSGEELIREVKTIRPEIPIVLCSGYSESFQRKDSALPQAAAFCEKPVKFTELLKLVVRLCSQSRQF